MDRQTVYFGQLSRDTDFLLAQQNAMVGIAKLAASILGTGNTIAANFTCIPTTPATLNVLVTPGEIYQIENLEQSQWSSVAQDGVHSILKQGLLADPFTISIAPPATIGFSQVYLIEVQYQDLDTGALVLPYFNVLNPSIPFLGPGNSGTAQNTIRKGAVAIQTKAGVGATTGTQTKPTVDAGWIGLFYVTVSNGQTTITAGNITLVPNAAFNTAFAQPPFVPVTLPSVPAGVQSGRWEYCVDTGAVNAMVGTVDPAPTALVAGMAVRIKVANSNTGATTFNLNTLGVVAVRRANLSALQTGDLTAGMIAELIYDGTGWQVANFEGFTSSTTNNNTFVLTIPYATDSSANVNQVIAPFAPAITTLTAGTFVTVKIVGTNTGPATLQANATAATNIRTATTTTLGAGQMVDGMVGVFSYDGVAWHLHNPATPSAALQIAQRRVFFDPSGHATSAQSPNFVEGLRILPAFQPISAGNKLWVSTVLSANAQGRGVFNSKTNFGAFVQYSVDSGATWITAPFPPLTMDQEATAFQTQIVIGTQGEILVAVGNPSHLFRIIFACTAGDTISVSFDNTSMHIVEYTG